MPVHRGRVSAWSFCRRSRLTGTETEPAALGLCGDGNRGRGRADGDDVRRTWPTRSSRGRFSRGLLLRLRLSRATWLPSVHGARVVAVRCQSLGGISALESALLAAKRPLWRTPRGYPDWPSAARPHALAAAQGSRRRGACAAVALPCLCLVPIHCVGLDVRHRAPSSTTHYPQPRAPTSVAMSVRTGCDGHRPRAARPTSFHEVIRRAMPVERAPRSLRRSRPDGPR